MKKISASLTILIGILFIGVFTSFPIININISDQEEEMKLSAGEITIVTPENKTYTGPMSGYYPGTFGFENESIGDSPQGWNEFSEANRETSIIESFNGHKNVFRLYDNAASASLTSVNWFSPQTHGTIEYWLATSDINMACSNIIFGGGGPDWGIVFTIRNGYFQYRDSSVYHTITGAPIPQNNQWYHIRIDFRCNGAPSYQTLNETRFFAYINGIKYGEFPFVTAVSQINGSSIGLGYSSTLTSYLDAKGYSWDPDYFIGDNLNEGLLLSYENTTTLDWKGYSLDGTANKTIRGNTTIPMQNDGIHFIQMSGNDSLGTMYESNLRYFTVDTSPYLNIVTPENITYSEPMSGFFPASFGFENEVDGTTGTSIDFVDIDDSDGGCYFEMRPHYSGHRKVMALIDDGVGMNIVTALTQFSPQEFGTMECWLWNAGDPHNIYTEFWNGASPLGGLRTGSDWVSYDDSGWIVIPGAPTPVPGTWNHIRIDFRCGTTEYMGLNQWDFQIWINGVVYGPFTFDSNLQPNRQRFATMTSGGGAYTTYTDAIGHSWDQNYNIGDNLNEGILLGIDTNIDFNWTGYSLDKQSNKTIFGNTTIAMPSDGIHSIQIFGNDSIGTIYESNNRYFTVATGAPEIFIIAPTDSQVIGSTAPNYDISIVGPYDYIWYALEGGSNYTASGLTGTIDQSAWSALSDGIITIDFYANNSAGMEGKAQVQVIKDSSEELPPGIPGYDIIALIGVCSIITLIVLKNKKGRIKK